MSLLKSGFNRNHTKRSHRMCFDSLFEAMLSNFFECQRKIWNSQIQDCWFTADCMYPNPS